MTELMGKEQVMESFSLRKISLSVKKEEDIKAVDKKFADKVKLLELSNVIDDWEKELLFSEKGFFRLKGKQVENKTKEYISELEKFINSKISKITFSLEKSRFAALEIKRIKIEKIKRQLIRYEKKELYEWEIAVYNESIEAAHDKAVLYKDDMEAVIQAINNGISVISLMAERENWTKNIFKIKKEKFISNCCFDIIKSFLDEKDINFPDYYNTYSKYLNEEQKEEIEKSVAEIKNNILGYNWAVELFSYNLSDEENEKEIKKLKDSNFEIVVRKYIEILKTLKEIKDKDNEKLEIQKSWDKIISLLEKEPEKALLYIDITKERDIIKSQKEYIKQIINTGFIETNKKEFIQLLELILKKFNEFKELNLTKYRYLLSEFDYEFFEKLQKQTESEKLKFIAEYKFLFEKLNQEKIKNVEEKYDSILNYRLAIEEYKNINSKQPDFEKRHKIIEFILQQKEVTKGVKE